jgi:V-type H+-transporting ATPase subunit H
MTIQYRQLQLESSYLDDYRNAIRSKTIPWDGFARSQLIEEKDSKNLIKLEKLYFDKSKSLANAAVDGSFQEYVTTLLKLLTQDFPPERNDVRKFVLVAISDFLNIESFVDELISKRQISDFLSALTAHADAADEIVRLLSLYSAGIILIQNGTEFNEFDILQIINELIELLSVNSNFNLKNISINLISEILSSSNKPYRNLFWSKHDELLPLLFGNLSSTFLYSSASNSKSTVESIQFEYKVLLTIWILSFQTDKTSIISKYYLEELLLLTKVLKISIKEKITRLIISTLLNFTSAENSASLNILKFLILNGDFISILNNLKERKWGDEELIADLEQLTTNTTEIFNKLTSFDEYAQELTMKKFKNSPVHYKEEFFLDNLAKFQDNNYKIFKQVLSVLDEEHLDSTTLKILLNDLNKLLRIDSNTLDILVKAGYKVKIMQLLNHKNSEVRYEALKTTQLLVSQSLK